MGTREVSVERHFNEQIRQLGGLTRKWISTLNGVPDRIAFLPGGRIWFVEIKTVDGRLSPEQQREHQRLMDLGAAVVTLYGHDDVDKFIRSMRDEGIDYRSR